MAAPAVGRVKIESTQAKRVLAAEAADSLSKAPRLSDASTASGGPSSSSSSSEGADSDVDVMETEAPVALNKTGADVQMENEDEDVQFVGRTGDIALTDFPHSRENCASVPFVRGKEAACCANCYCYVCDQPAKACPEWADHCKASHGELAWRQKRAQWKARPPAPAAAPAAAAAPSSSTASASTALVPARAATPASVSTRKKWSCDAIYKALEQVWPVETPEPAGLLPSIKLRPYQKQSLAFMLDRERAADSESEKLGSSNQGGRSLSSWSANYRTVRGGWLCDEMGMGKTAVVTALVLANPKALYQSGASSASASSSAASSSAAAASSKAKPELSSVNMPRRVSEDKTLKVTLIVVNNTLVQQWEEEVKRFAPGLKVHVLYNGAGRASGGRAAAVANLRSADVLITTPHAKWPGELLGERGHYVHGGHFDFAAR